MRRVLLAVAVSALLLAAIRVVALPGYSQAWSTTLDGSIVDMDVGGKIAAVTGDKLYIIQGDGSHIDVGLDYTPVAVSVQGDTVAVASQDRVYLYADDGSLQRSFSVSGVEDVAVTPSLIVLATTGGVYAYTYDGSQQWAATSTGGVDVVAATAGAVYAANSKVYKLSTDGTVEWDVSMGSAVKDLYPVSSDSVLVATEGSIALIKSGAVTWKEDFSTAMKTVALCDGIVVAYGSGHVYGLSLSDGSTLWTDTASGSPVKVRCSPKTVYVALSDTVVKYEKLAGVTVTSEPSGATVYIDGVTRGKTPLTISLPPGSHRVKLVYKTFTISDTFTLEPGASVTLHYTFNGTLIVTTKPPKSRVRINGKCMGFTPVRVELRPGTYDLWVINGPLSFRRNIRIKPGRVLNISVVFNGTLIVETRPEGIPVKVDGSDAGKTPVRMEVEPGPHHVVINFKNRTIIRTLNIEPGGYGRVFIQFNSTLTVDITPPDAQVYLDGKLLAAAKFGKPLKLDPGQHVVLAYCGGHTYRRILELGAGQDALVRAVFNLSLKVDSVPQRVDVYVNGSKKGSTPLTLLLPAGRYLVELRYGGENVSRLVDLEKCGDRSLTVIFNSTIRIETFPSGVPVSVDGNQVGTSPIIVKVPVGRHVVGARWLFLDKRKTVDVDTGGAMVKFEFWEPFAALGASIGAVVLLLVFILLARREGGYSSKPLGAYSEVRPARPPPPRRRRREEEEWESGEDWDEW